MDVKTPLLIAFYKQRHLIEFFLILLHDMRK